MKPINEHGAAIYNALCRQGFFDTAERFWENMSSNYPPGESGAPQDAGEQEHFCPNCGHEWKARMYNELGGGFYYNDDDAFCEKCQTEGEYK